MSYHLYIKIHNDALTPYYEKAIQKWETSKDDIHRDSGFDLFISNPFTNVNTRYDKPIVIDHQVSCAVYKDVNIYVKNPSGYYMFPRSSISKTPYRLANSVGIIDSGYRGPLMAKVDVLPAREDYPMKQGDRMFQICAPDLSPFESVQITDTLDETSRGSGGFGSTGR